MESKTKLLGHPVHPMLVVFPLGLLSTSVVFDALHTLTKKKDFAKVSYWTLVGGLIGGLSAAPFGIRDWLAVPQNTRAKQVGLWHGVGNDIVITLFGLSWLLRRKKPEQPSATAVGLSLLGASLSLGTAWLGGELSYRLGVGVDTDANLNASSSLEPTPSHLLSASDKPDHEVIYTMRLSTSTTALPLAQARYSNTLAKEKVCIRGGWLPAPAQFIPYPDVIAIMAWEQGSPVSP